MTKEEAKKFGLQLLHGIMERNESYPVYANNVKQAINALSEESNSSEIPNDLEEAAVDAINEYCPEGVSITEGAVFTKSAMIGMFKDGAKWDRSQMLKDVIEGEYDSYPASVYLDAPVPGIEHGEKVRVIVLKIKD